MPLTTIWLSFKTTIDLLIKCGKFESMTETFHREKLYGIGARHTQLRATCSIKIKDVENGFNSRLTMSTLEPTTWKKTEKDEREVISKARRECLRKIRDAIPDIFDGMGIEAERG